ncbi:MAG: M48 family metallopeptidase, partial [Nitrosopumilus sp.]|nr:M48 family metallopeptidase [Nitrosopumilus sp.]
MYSFKYGEVTIPYDIIKSGRIKTSQIAIDRNGVIVRIPNTKSIEQTKLMVLQKAQWIFKKRLQYKNQIPQIPQITFKKYSTIPFKGKNYPFEVILGRSAGVNLEKNIMQFHITQKRHSISQLRQMYQKWLHHKAGVYLSTIIAKNHSIAGKPLRITIKSLKGRWGSTTKSGEVILNANLMKAPAPVI